MKNDVKSLDDLETGIKQLLLEDRCSFSNKEKVLLNDCIHALQQAKEFNLQPGNPDIGLIAKVIELLTKLFIAGEHFKDLL